MSYLSRILSVTAVVAGISLLSATSALAAACTTPNQCMASPNCVNGGNNDTCTTSGYTCCNPTTSSTPTGASCTGGKVVGGVCFPTGTGLAGESTGSLTIAGLLVNILQWLLAIFGVLALIVFVVMGYKYLFAGVNEEQAEQAKAGVTYAVIGIIIALSGYIIVSFLGEIFTV